MEGKVIKNSSHTGGRYEVGCEGRDDGRAHDHGERKQQESEGRLFTITSTGSLHERTAWVPEIQHGTQLHLLWSSKVRILGLQWAMARSIRCNVTSLGGWAAKLEKDERQEIDK